MENKEFFKVYINYLAAVKAASGKETPVGKLKRLSFHFEVKTSAFANCVEIDNMYFNSTVNSYRKYNVEDILLSVKEKTQTIHHIPVFYFGTWSSFTIILNYHYYE